MKEHLVDYISYINNILVSVKLMKLIELKVELVCVRGSPLTVMMVLERSRGSTYHAEALTGNQ
jgi:hypothetical protein